MKSGDNYRLAAMSRPFGRLGPNRAMSMVFSCRSVQLGLLAPYHSGLAPSGLGGVPRHEGIEPPPGHLPKLSRGHRALGKWRWDEADSGCFFSSRPNSSQFWLSSPICGRTRPVSRKCGHAENRGSVPRIRVPTCGPGFDQVCRSLFRRRRNSGQIRPRFCPTATKLVLPEAAERNLSWDAF